MGVSSERKMTESEQEFEVPQDGVCKLCGLNRL